MTCLDSISCIDAGASPVARCERASIRRRLIAAMVAAALGAVALVTASATASAAPASSPATADDDRVPATHLGWLRPAGDALVTVVPPHARPADARHCDAPTSLPADAGWFDAFADGRLTLYAWPRLAALDDRYTGCQWELLAAPDAGGSHPIGVTVFRDGQVIARTSAVPGLRSLVGDLPPVCRFDNGRPVPGSDPGCRSAVMSTPTASRDAACVARMLARADGLFDTLACPSDFRPVRRDLPPMPLVAVPMCHAGTPWARVDDERLPSLGEDPRDRALHVPLVSGAPAPFDQVRDVVEAGFPLDRRMAYGETLLHWAARVGDLAQVRWLLDRGAAPDARNGAGETPLFVALATQVAGPTPVPKRTAHAIARELLDRGADPAVIALVGGSRHDARDLARQVGWTDLLPRLPSVPRPPPGVLSGGC